MTPTLPFTPASPPDDPYAEPDEPIEVETTRLTVTLEDELP